jgi:hypothetical protein
MFGIALSEQSTERETALTFGWRAAAHPVPTPPIPASTWSLWRGAQGFVEVKHQLSPRLTSMASRG